MFHRLSDSSLILAETNSRKIAHLGHDVDEGCWFMLPLATLGTVGKLERSRNTSNSSVSGMEAGSTLA